MLTKARLTCTLEVQAILQPGWCCFGLKAASFWSIVRIGVQTRSASLPFRMHWSNKYVECAITGHCTSQSLRTCGT
jgi:hypothetical protein